MLRFLRMIYTVAQPIDLFGCFGILKCQSTTGPRDETTHKSIIAVHLLTGSRLVFYYVKCSYLITELIIYVLTAALEKHVSKFSVNMVI